MSKNEEQAATSIEISLIDTVAKGELKNLTFDFAEVALDAVLNDELVKSIPVVGTIMKLYNATVSIRDRMFMKKVARFLSELNDIDQVERQHFADRLGVEAGTRSRAGEALALLLERLDDLDKPQIIGRIYRAKLEKRIIFNDLRRYCMIVDRAHLPDLVAIAQLPVGEPVDDNSAPYLHALGLVSITGQDYGTIDGVGAKTWFEVNELGRRFISIAFPS